jgi:hypothetical protein
MGVMATAGGWLAAPDWATHNVGPRQPAAKPTHSAAPDHDMTVSLHDIPHPACMEAAAG